MSEIKEERIIRSGLNEVIGERYLNYAMYVAKERALPNVFDGCKPVQRRILFDMYELGLFYNKPYKKSARIVGDTLGKYHPHGDTSVYGAMVNLAQDFSMRYPLVDGHGNFGSVDGDGAAAMRYTESRLTRLGQYMMNDINKNTIDFKPNYDGEEQEPVVLPSLFPALLANGSMGIAVGLATSIPSHNLKDIYACMYHMLDCALEEVEPDINDLIKLIQAPDFPTGGEIIGLDDVYKAYREGQGRVVLRGKHIVETNKKQTSIIITEIPYKTNKTTLVNKIADNIKDKKNSKGTITDRALFPQIKEVRDESNKDGMRIVIDLKQDESPEIVINNLIKQNTGYQRSIGMNLMALKDKVPVLYNLKDALDDFMGHSANVIIRRTQYDYDKAQTRLNIVNGMIKLFELGVLDLVIETIRSSENPELDIQALGFNEAQAKYICDMKLRSLSKISEDSFANEKENLDANISHWKLILEDEVTLIATIRKEFQECEKLFGDERKTTITLDVSTIEDEDLIEDEELLITYTTDGVIKAVEESVYNTQRRGGKGVSGANAKEDEAIKFMFTTNSKDDLLFFTNTGRCYTLKAFRIGKSTKAAKGKSINNYLNLEPGEKILNVLNTNIKKNPDSYLLMVTKLGTIKKLALKELSTRYAYTRVITFKENDSLCQARLINDENIIIVTQLGQSIRINTALEGGKAIRPMGRTAAGVRAITLKEEDEVVDMCLVTDQDSLLTMTEFGLAKRTKVSEWGIIGRGGKGVVAHKLSNKTGAIVCALVANNDEELLIATANGQIQKISNESIRECGRATVGVKAMNLAEDDFIVSASSCKVIVEESGEEA